jgi:hypothetical protein
MLLRLTVAAALLLATALPASAQAKKKPRPKVPDDVQKYRESDYWIYNDLDRGMAEARRAGKPLLVVIRCIP